MTLAPFPPSLPLFHPPADAYVQAAKALKGIVNVAAVDGTQNQQIAGKLQIQGFPTVKLFADNRAKPLDYEGQRDAKSIVEWVLKQVQSVTRERLGGKSSGSGARNTGSSSGSGSGSAGSDGKFGGKHITTLTEDNFDSIIGKDEAVFVAFYAPCECRGLRG